MNVGFHARAAPSRRNLQRQPSEPSQPLFPLQKTLAGFPTWYHQTPLKFVESYE
jgi:hypothetical protein